MAVLDVPGLVEQMATLLGCASCGHGSSGVLKDFESSWWILVVSGRDIDVYPQMFRRFDPSLEISK